jgi:hypothetical protein
MRTTRNGGLYLNGDTVMRDEVEDYDKILREAKTEQLNAQYLMTSADIFKKIEDRLKGVGVTVIGGERKEAGIEMAAAILQAFDNEGLFVSTNYRQLLILPRLDSNTNLTMETLGNVFQRFINAIDPIIEGTSTTFSGISGTELYDIFLLRLTMH